MAAVTRRRDNYVKDQYSAKNWTLAIFLSKTCKAKQKEFKTKNIDD